MIMYLVDPVIPIRPVGGEGFLHDCLGVLFIIIIIIIIIIIVVTSSLLIAIIFVAILSRPQ